MCGTLHPVGTASCSTCRATGVGQLRLMFECPTCGRLGLSPACAACPPANAGEELIVAEEVTDEPFSLDEFQVVEGEGEVELVLDYDEDEADESLVVDASDDRGEELDEDVTELDEDAFDLDDEDD